MQLALNQIVTYWAPGDENQFGGKTYLAPVEIKARWEDKVENIIDRNGQDAVSRAKIMTEVPVEATGFLYPEPSNAVDPTAVAGAWEIRIVGSVPNLSNLQRLYAAYI